MSELAQRRVRDFQQRCGETALHLAYHAALPVALNADLLHFLRINFFLDSAETLLYTIEFELLLSPLCREIDEGLYEIEPEIRDILLAGLAQEYDEDRIRDVATLLWQYVDRFSAWSDRVELERAQQLTALNFLSPEKAQHWLSDIETDIRQGSATEREWFIAMQKYVKAQVQQKQNTNLTQSQIPQQPIAYANSVRVANIESQELLEEKPKNQTRRGKVDAMKRRRQAQVRKRSVALFFSYSHKDEQLRNELAEHLTGLRRDGVISEWHDRKVEAGTEWAKEIDANLKSADIILLLVSASFLHSDYCWSEELSRAMKRHEAGEACVIPIILRPTNWKAAPFAKLQAFPTNAKPVTAWQNRDEAFLDVVRGIEEVVDQWQQHSVVTLEETERDRQAGERLASESVQEVAAVTTEIKESGQGEEHYRDEVLFCLKQDSGEISDISRVILNGVRETLELSVDRAVQIEDEVSRPFKIFRKAVIDLKIQSVTPTIQARLDRLQQVLKLSDEDATMIIKDILPTMPPES